MQRASLIGLGLALALSGAAAAQTAPAPDAAPAGAPGDMHRGMHGMHGPRGDRTVSKADMLKRSHDMFARIDLNGDGKITIQEVEQFHAQMRARMVQARVDRMFERFDTNHDGQISKAEATQAVETRAEHRGEGMGEHGMGGPGDGRRMMMMHRMHGMGGMHGHGGWMGAGGKGAAGLFERFDTNHDGVITLQEFDAPILARFAKLDTNGDGVISPEERQAAHHGPGDRQPR